MILCLPWATGCDVRILSSLTLMTFTSCLSQTEHARCTIFSTSSCRWAPESSSAQEKQERGIVEDYTPELEDLGEEVWSQGGIKILGTPVGSPDLLTVSLSGGWMTRDGTWVPDLQCVANSCAVCRAKMSPHPPHVAA